MLEWFKLPRNGWKLLELAGIALYELKHMHISGMVAMVADDLKWPKISENDWMWLYMVRGALNGWK